MTYTVVWGSSAEGELASLWLAAKNRDQVTAMVAVLDGLLRTTPEVLGESRSHNRRILLHGGLAVVYEIIPEDSLVRVLAVWET